MGGNSHRGTSRAAPPFVHLHVHSYYSLLDATASPEALVTAARQLGFTALALTDHNALHGAVEFYRAARDAGIHPIIGAEVDIADDGRLVLLVMNGEGYRNLSALLTRGHLTGGHLAFRLDRAELFRFNRGLLALAGGHSSLLWQQVKSRRMEAAARYCRDMHRVFGDRFYIELQSFSEDDVLPNVRLRDLAVQHHIPLVATNDVHFLTPEDFAVRRVLRAIHHNTLLDRVPDAGSPQQYLKSAAEMTTVFRNFPQALATTVAVARRCRFAFSLGRPVFPALSLPPDTTPATHLKQLVLAGARQRYRPLTRPILRRLLYELHTILRLGFAEYFLIVKDIVDFCNREGIPCVGRGSAGDSLVAYVLGITHVDPLRYNLYFERFLNPERSDPPDIDLDICWKNRDRVLAYVYEKYGTDRTAMICTFNTFQLRSAIRDVARVYGLPESEIATLTRYLPHGSVHHLEDTLAHIPECRTLRDSIPTVKQVLTVAQRIADLPRHQSIHPGGVIIAPERITHYTPLQVAGKGIVISQYDMYSIEALGLVKMDLLGVRSLTIVSDTLAAITALFRQCIISPGEAPPVYRLDVTRGKIVPERPEAYLTPQRFPFLDARRHHLSPLDLRVIPENDHNAITLLRNGFSLGCFQTESPGMRGLLRKMQIDSMDDVITAVALIRPGAANSGMKEQYIRRRAGKEPVTYLHPRLETVLKDTYGNILYQEQVMQVAVEIAGFSLAQADVLRKAMTKSRDRRTLYSMYREFIDGAMRNGLSREAAENVWHFLANFVGYGFNKAHAATYGTIAYQTAYLKAYFPVQYMTAVLNNEGGFYSTAAYIEECRRMGIRLLPPDVNASDEFFTGEGDAIRVGLHRVRELTARTRARILAERRHRPFSDYYDFVLRVRPREKEVTHLIKCGALRSIEPNEPQCLLRHQLFFKHRRRRTGIEHYLKSVRLQPYNRHQRILNEMEMLDFAVTDHPLTLFEAKIDPNETVPSTALEAHAGKRVVVVGWLVTSRRVKTREGTYMKFLTLEDRHGLCEAVLFPPVYERYGHLLQTQGPYRVEGVVQSRLPGEANLLVEHLAVISLEKAELEARLRAAP